MSHLWSRAAMIRFSSGYVILCVCVQECFSLTDVQPVGCVLATTTSTLLLIYHTTTGVACRRLQVYTGTSS